MVRTMTSTSEKMIPIWFDELTGKVKAIDQRELPHRLVIIDLDSVETIIMAIQQMVVRGAPLIGVTGAYGVYVAIRDLGPSASDAEITATCHAIRDTRPTAVNLAFAVDNSLTEVFTANSFEARLAIARQAAEKLAAEETENCKMIGRHGLPLIESIFNQKGQKTVNILTHCNAGWLACIEYGTATAPIYTAAEAGIDVHVWVDETRPLNQGARLTAWELGRQEIKHTVIADNTGGHLMQHDMVDMVIVGTDRTTHTGDVANKIGTYLKALAAWDNRIPFYVALPSTTFDWKIKNGISGIPIEKRDPEEIRYIQGLYHEKIVNVLVPPVESPVANYAFDVTPARLVTGLITERGVCRAKAEDIARLFPERAAANRMHAT